MLVFLFATSLWGAKLSNDLQRVSPGSMVDVIVQFEAPPTEPDFNDVLGSGGALKQRLPNIQGALFSLPGAALRGIANNPRVRYIYRTENSPARWNSPSQPSTQTSRCSTGGRAPASAWRSSTAAFPAGNRTSGTGSRIPKTSFPARTRAMTSTGTGTHVGGHCGRRRLGLDGLELHLHVSGDRAERELGQSAGARQGRPQNGFGRDPGARPGGRSERTHTGFES